jgi:hypothetical protein
MVDGVTYLLRDGTLLIIGRVAHLLRLLFHDIRLDLPGGPFLGLVLIFYLQLDGIIFDLGFDLPLRRGFLPRCRYFWLDILCSTTRSFAASTT